MSIKTESCLEKHQKILMFMLAKNAEFFDNLRESIPEIKELFPKVTFAQ